MTQIAFNQKYPQYEFLDTFMDFDIYMSEKDYRAFKISFDGKGNKQYESYIANTSKEYIEDYLTTTTNLEIR